MIDEYGSERIVVNGFLMEKAPPIAKRILLPYSSELSIPRKVDDGYELKLRVYKDEGKWRIDIPDILKSDSGLEFDSQMEAMSFVCYALTVKENIK